MVKTQERKKTVRQCEQGQSARGHARLILCMYMNVCMYVCISLSIYIYIYMYIYIVMCNVHVLSRGDPVTIQSPLV